MTNPITNQGTPIAPILQWSRSDFERRFGLFKAGAYTNVNKFLGFLLAIFLTGGFFFFISALMQNYQHLCDDKWFVAVHFPPMYFIELTTYVNMIKLGYKIFPLLPVDI